MDGSKTQTIRKWKWDRNNFTKEEAIQDGDAWRIKVGTPLQIYWKMRLPKLFRYKCKPCGWVANSFKNRVLCPSCGEEMEYQKQIDGSEKLFDAVCNEAFLVKMEKYPDGEYALWDLRFSDGDGYYTQYAEEVGDLAKRDGFRAYTVSDMNIKDKTAAEKMFEWFDKHYDLSKPKVFQVIRWRRRYIMDWKKARKKPVVIQYREVNGDVEIIHTREGSLTAYKDQDYIIKGTHDEIYPISKIIFYTVYDVVGDDE